MRSVCSLLAQQFVSGVGTICQTSTEEDVHELRSYLLHDGRGAVILNVIDTLGVEVSLYCNIYIFFIYIMQTVDQHISRF